MAAASLLGLGSDNAGKTGGGPLKGGPLKVMLGGGGGLHLEKLGHRNIHLARHQNPTQTRLSSGFFVPRGVRLARHHCMLLGLLGNGNLPAAK